MGTARRGEKGQKGLYALRDAKQVRILAPRPNGKSGGGVDR